MGKKAKKLVPFLLLAACCAGCPVLSSQDVPVPATRNRDPATDAAYWLYVPEDYAPEKAFPLAIVLHGTRAPAYDTADKQINEWKRLAEDENFIVAAPVLDSVQGILPVIKPLWRKDLDRDERVILSLLNHLSGKYNIDCGRVLLTGFSSGGYPLYYTGLRNPTRFNALVADACNSSLDIFENVELTDEARETPIFIFWGKDDFRSIQREGWQAFRYLRERGFKRTHRKEIEGGHFRRPGRVYDFWMSCPPRKPDR
jgi:phospholipase/carboxylesterase